jgi:hypothetical protein
METTARGRATGEDSGRHTPSPTAVETFGMKAMHISQAPSKRPRRDSDRSRNEKFMLRYSNVAHQPLRCSPKPPSSVVGQVWPRVIEIEPLPLRVVVHWLSGVDKALPLAGATRHPTGTTAVLALLPILLAAAATRWALGPCLSPTSTALDIRHGYPPFIVSREVFSIRYPECGIRVPPFRAGLWRADVTLLPGHRHGDQFRLCKTESGR